MSVFWVFCKNSYRNNSLKEGIRDSSGGKVQIFNMYGALHSRHFVHIISWQ